MRLEERLLPEPKENEVVVKMKVAAVCGSDLSAYRMNKASSRFSPPIVLGHEVAGEIAACGKNAKKFAIGTRVSANPILYCGGCFYCKRGEINLCENRNSFGTSIGGKRVDGAMQEFFAIREEAIVPLSGEISFEEGAFLEPLAVCLNSARAGSFGRGERVVVIGAGPIGLLNVKFLKMMGASCIIVSDIVDAKLEFAKKYGADAAVNVQRDSLIETTNRLTLGVGADRVIVASGNQSAISLTFSLVRNGGCVVLVALPWGEVAINPKKLVTCGISIIGSYMFRWEQFEVMKMLAEGKIKVRDMITLRCPLPESEGLFDKLSAPDWNGVKAILTCD